MLEYLIKQIYALNTLKNILRTWDKKDEIQSKKMKKQIKQSKNISEAYLQDRKVIVDEIIKSKNKRKKLISKNIKH